MKTRPNFQDYRNFLPSRKMVIRFVLYGVVLLAVLWWLAQQDKKQLDSEVLPDEIELEGVEF